MSSGRGSRPRRRWAEKPSEGAERAHSLPRRADKAPQSTRLPHHGLLEVGEPIDWPDSLDVIGYIREHGIQQFLNLYNRVKAIEGDSLLWGDEVEYAVLSLDETESTARLSLRGAEILAELKAREEQSHPEMSRYERCAWVPEYGSWMVEDAGDAVLGLRDRPAPRRAEHARAPRAAQRGAAPGGSRPPSRAS